MIINPELTAATEISRLLRFPSAIKIDTFAKGRVELLKFRIKPEFHLNNMPVSQIGSPYKQRYFNLRRRARRLDRDPGW